jgi:N-acyl amino acid synthase of PEP-CTERM/exosortase system
MQSLAHYERGQGVRPGANLWRAFALRFAVYCCERAYLSAEDYPDGLEIDEYDERAAHFFSFDDAGELVGYVRLVRTDGAARFPLQNYCKTDADAKLPPDHEAMEVSRLIIRQDYRRSRSGSVPNLENVVFGRRNSDSSAVLLDLYRQMYAYSRERGVRYWYAAMERPLARALNSLNFKFRQVGPQADYFGPIAPYVADLRELEAELAHRRPALLESFQEAARLGVRHAAHAFHRPGFAGNWAALA